MIGTIIGRYKQIIACLADDPDDLEPIFWEGPESEVIVSDWAGGFLDAVALRLKAWEPLINDSQAGIMMIPIFLLGGDAEFRVEPDEAADREQFMLEVPDMIPECVAGIQAFWKDRHHEPRGVWPSRRPSARRRRR